MEAVEDGSHVVPTEFTPSKLRSCMSCSLIKTTSQFTRDGCDNCPFLGLAGDRERVLTCTTNSFIGIYVCMKPRSSWVGKWQRVVKFVPGSYAVALDAGMPGDVVEQLEDNGHVLPRILARVNGEEG
eukprot:Plantae.Rhodophyta-Hildenbrandia_rubra.ctg47033.p1 GENE.Plantae.Rhodophyta-Hildenbrandia_rubra.ctg47033~~Plantae.Rhodophyta-Hildenbrandia_rubra.ctg47033.p1  ORF type:complete len:148 (-),score=20.23 Plantae.Rhodophyta-Hildenbrandia_rubra.ctg47033:409-789(-)